MVNLIIQEKLENNIYIKFRKKFNSSKIPMTKPKTQNIKETFKKYINELFIKYF